MEAYLAWCREHGVELHGVAPGVAGGLRGVVATRRLEAGEKGFGLRVSSFRVLGF